MAGHYGGSNAVRFSLAQDVEEKTVFSHTFDISDPFYPKNSPGLIIQIKDLEYGYCNSSIDEYEKQREFNLSQNHPNPFY